MNHFLEINQFTSGQAMALIERAFYFKNNSNYPSYPHATVANLFYENSTRTRVSFELAAKKLAMGVVNVNLQSSSESKGEVVEDTIHTLAAMGITHFVVRHSKDGLPHALAEICGEGVHIINAGDGTHAHPSQAMLDMMTIMDAKPDVRQLKIAIVGDVRHSRVAHSLQDVFALFGVRELVFVAPKIWLPQSVHYGKRTSTLQDGIENADVVICLRVQRERLSEAEQLDLASYHHEYGISRNKLAHAKPDVLVMHPGPMNRGVEIDSEVADGPQSHILQQVTNGVFMRMAILELLSGPHELPG